MGRKPNQGRGLRSSEKLGWGHQKKTSQSEEDRLLELIRTAPKTKKAPSYPLCKDDECTNRRGSCGMCREHCQCKEK